MELGQVLVHDGLMAFHQRHAVARMVAIFGGNDELLGLVDEAKESP